MSLDSGTISLWLQVVGILLLPMLSVAYTWVATRDKDNTVHIKAVEAAMVQRMTEHSSRLDKVETAVQYMPTPAQMSELQGDVQAMQATQDAIQRDIVSVRSSLVRIEDFLLRN